MKMGLLENSPLIPLKPRLENPLGIPNIKNQGPSRSNPTQFIEYPIEKKTYKWQNRENERQKGYYIFYFCIIKHVKNMLSLFLFVKAV